MSEGVEDWTIHPFQVPEGAGRTPPLHLPKKASDRNGTNSYSGMCGMTLIIVSWGSSCCLCRTPYYFYKALLQFKCFLGQTVFFLFEVWAPLGIGSIIWRCLSYWSGIWIILYFHLYMWCVKMQGGDQDELLWPYQHRGVLCCYIHIHRTWDEDGPVTCGETKKAPNTVLVSPQVLGLPSKSLSYWCCTMLVIKPLWWQQAALLDISLASAQPPSHLSCPLVGEQLLTYHEECVASL